MGSAELRLRSRILNDAKASGLWGSNVNDRFVSAKPDIRLSCRWCTINFWQLDVELKILGVAQSTIDSDREVLSGVTKLQEIEIRDMNRGGARAVGLILIPEYDLFVFCNFKKIRVGTAINRGPRVLFNPRKAEGPALDFWQLFAASEEYLRSIGAW
jgi:hypothetical protein